MPLTTITGGGTFTRLNVSQINGNFAALSQPDIWVRPAYGNNNTANGSFDKPYATMAGAAGSPSFIPGAVVGILGVLLEEFISPAVNDITVVGMGNQPRQATSNGIANGGGSTWLSPSGGTGHLLQINGQGWKVQNLYFNNSATAAACIHVNFLADIPPGPDGSLAWIVGNVLTGTDDGIKLTGPNHVIIEGNTLFGFSGAGDLAISASGGAGTLLNTRIFNNRFLGNDGHITAGLTNSEIYENRFSYIYSGKTTVTQVVLTGGENNSVHDNSFDIPETTTGLAAMFTLGTNDRWYFNKLSTAQTTTLYVFGGPQTS